MMKKLQNGCQRVKCALFAPLTGRFCKTKLAKLANSGDDRARPRQNHAGCTLFRCKPLFLP